jgi:hypothetical protein
MIIPSGSSVQEIYVEKINKYVNLEQEVMKVCGDWERCN